MRTYTCIHTYIHMHRYTHIHTYLCIHTYTCIHTHHTHIYIYTYRHAHEYAHTYTYRHTHECALTHQVWKPCWVGDLCLAPSKFYQQKHVTMHATITWTDQSIIFDAAIMSSTGNVSLVNSTNQAKSIQVPSTAGTSVYPSHRTCIDFPIAPRHYLLKLCILRLQK